MSEVRPFNERPGPFCGRDDKVDAPAASIFLSYARGDDEAFARRLYGDLTAGGFEVWFDRVAMPSRDLTFHQEIADAIRARDRLLLVVGPKAAASAYVSQEWRWAWELDKVIPPIYRIGPDGFGLVPDELRLFHCEDFRDDRAYATALGNLVRQLRQSVARPGRLIAVPELPRHFLALPNRLRALREAVTADLRGPHVLAGARGRVGLHGMAGVGKTVLALAVAHDRGVRKAYPDGIVWLAFGQQPEAVRLQRLVAGALGTEASFGDPATGRAVLRDLLLDKAVMLVCDDLWQAGHFAGALEGCLGPRCRTLITARDLGLLRHVTATQHSVDVLCEADALALLAKVTDQDVEDLPEEAREVARECAGLPLALVLCGGMARGEHAVAWSGILHALRERRLEDVADEQGIDPRHASVWKAIAVSVDLLSPDQRRRFAELAVFPEDDLVPDAVVKAFWSHSGSLDELASDLLLRRLWEQSLIRLTTPRQGGAPGRCVSMHDLIHGYAERIAGDGQALNRRFADAARSVYAERPGSFVGYLKDHLPRHLVAASDPSGLRELLCDAKLDYFQQWAEQGMAAEGVRCLEFLCESLRRSPAGSGLLPVLATQLARLYNRLADQDGAERWLPIALREKAGDAGSDQVQAVALHELGSLALTRGDYVQARLAYRRALRIARRTSPPLLHEIAANLVGLAGVQYLKDLDANRTARLGRLALACAEAAQDAPHTAEACRILADVYKDTMQYEAAGRYLDRGLTLAEERGLTHARLSLLTAKAWMTYHRAALDGTLPGPAEEAFRRLLDCARSAGDWRFQGDAWSGLGQVALQGGGAASLDEAIDQLAALLRGRARPYLEARLLLLEACRLHRSASFAEAEEAYRRTAALAEREGLWSRQVDALVGCGAALFHAGRQADAERSWQRARAVLPRCPRLREVFTARSLERCRRDPSACPL